jgi:hypothetical protein
MSKSGVTLTSTISFDPIILPAIFDIIKQVHQFDEQRYNVSIKSFGSNLCMS